MRPALRPATAKASGKCRSASTVDDSAVVISALFDEAQLTEQKRTWLPSSTAHHTRSSTSRPNELQITILRPLDACEVADLQAATSTHHQGWILNLH